MKNKIITHYPNLDVVTITSQKDKIISAKTNSNKRKKNIRLLEKNAAEYKVISGIDKRIKRKNERNNKFLAARKKQ